MKQWKVILYNVTQVSSKLRKFNIQPHWMFITNEKLIDKRINSCTVLKLYQILLRQQIQAVIKCHNFIFCENIVKEIK